MSVILLNGLFTVLTLWVAGFVGTFRKDLTKMAGMMAAMAIGMTVGLALGSLFTIWLPGQFYQSTITSMLIGGLAGAIIGVPISLMAVLDGLLSGIMSGMMGTMLMVMIPAPYVDSAVKFIAILCSGIIFLLYIMLLGEVGAYRLKLKSTLLSKPISMFLVIAVSLAFALQMPTARGNSELKAEQSQNHSGHSQHQGDSSQLTDSNVPNVPELIVKAQEFSFTPSTINMKKNEKIKITLDNTGAVEHDFEIIGTNIHIHAAPGKKNSLIVSFDQTGYYQVVCTLPGHEEAGMSAFIQVS
ncbi:cupredoxin domain-containing protein [Paenibacillus sp. N1-5-1-14]|uniref:cupredoxin domain-containing protein n=1 Tax=Paenibacillus radicibacter TaxID=2972488 RepID=UPI0021594152|nr:cupredoxin domain-containing protein [Paenibacillus radicibacter]MCR8644340.1 cupredoxin domain-containing protein [Paenibacillus radicibacter]